MTNKAAEIIYIVVASGYGGNWIEAAFMQEALADEYVAEMAKANKDIKFFKEEKPLIHKLIRHEPGTYEIIPDSTNSTYKLEPVYKNTSH